MAGADSTSPPHGALRAGRGLSSVLSVTCPCFCPSGTQACALFVGRACMLRGRGEYPHLTLVDLATRCPQCARAPAPSHVWGSLSHRFSLDLSAARPLAVTHAQGCVWDPVVASGQVSLSDIGILLHRRGVPGEGYLGTGEDGTCACGCACGCCVFSRVCDRC